MAGDRGLLHPELPDAALSAELGEVGQRAFDGYYSLARTCEIALTERSGRPYESLAYLVEETTRPR
jgi:D-lactate dehydrogenase